MMRIEKEIDKNRMIKLKKYGDSYSTWIDDLYLGLSIYTITDENLNAA